MKTEKLKMMTKIEKKSLNKINNFFQFIFLKNRKIKVENVTFKQKKSKNVNRNLKKNNEKRQNKII